MAGKSAKVGALHADIVERSDDEDYSSDNSFISKMDLRGQLAQLYKKQEAIQEELRQIDKQAAEILATFSDKEEEDEEEDEQQQEEEQQQEQEEPEEEDPSQSQKKKEVNEKNTTEKSKQDSSDITDSDEDSDFEDPKKWLEKQHLQDAKNTMEEHKRMEKYIFSDSDD